MSNSMEVIQKEKDKRNKKTVYLNGNTEMEFSKCGLCMKLPDDARVLSCFHSFCLECLEEYMLTRLGKNYVSCPLCGRDTALTEDGVKGIRKNVYLSNSDDHHAHVSLTCDLCDDEREAEATCLDCGEKMCTFCHQSHKNSKASKHHRIKVFGTKFELQETCDKTEKHMCNVHETEERDCYCRKCQEQICKLCRNEEHKGHRTRPLKAFVNTQRKEISEAVEKIKDGYLGRIEKRLSEVTKQIKEISDKTNRVLLEIANHAENLKREIDMIKDLVIEDVQSKQKTIMSQFENLRQELCKELLAAGGCIQYIQNVLKLGSDQEVFDVSKSMGNNLQEMQNGKSLQKLEKVEINFETGGLTADILKNGFGHCTTRNTGSLRSRSVSFAVGEARDLCVQLVASFDYPSDKTDDDFIDDESIHGLCSTATGEAWVCCGWESTKLDLINNSGVIERQLDVESRIDDIARTQENDILLSCFKNTSVKKLNQDLEVSKLFKMPFYPRGLATSADGGLLVCMTDEYSTSLHKDSRRLVAKYSESGELIQSFENDGNRRLFTRPYRVAENVNGDICVTDKTSMGAGRLVVLDQDGNLKYIYEGSSNDLCRRGFSPAGLCCDRFGRVLIADSNNHCIHMLDKSGQFIGFLLTKEDDLISPHSLSLDPNGYLWVGDENGGFKVYLYV